MPVADVRRRCAILWWRSTRVVTLAALMLASGLAFAQTANQVPDIPTTALNKALLAKELEERLERERQAGLEVEAKSTAQKLRDLQQTQTTRCAGFWNAIDESERLAAQGRFLTPTEMKAMGWSSDLAAECAWRPATTSGQPAGGQSPRAPDVARTMFENETRWARTALFFEPVQFDDAVRLSEPDNVSAAILAVERASTLVRNGGDGYAIVYATALNELGVAYYRHGGFQQAIEAFVKTLATLERLPADLASDAFIVDDRLARAHANLALAYWNGGDATAAHRHFQFARHILVKPGASFVSESAALNEMRALAAELDVFLTLEMAAGSARTPSESIALPLLLERKGLVLDMKVDIFEAIARNPDELRDFRVLLARRALLAHQPTATPEELEARREAGREVDFHIKTVELAARQRETLAVSVAKVDRRLEEYNEALAKETSKLVARAYRRPAKDDRRSDAEISMDAMRQAAANIAPKFRDYLAAERPRLRGPREVLQSNIQSRLPTGVALLEMVRYRPFNHASGTATADRWQLPHYGAYLITKTGSPLLVDYGEAAPIDELIVEFRRALASPRGTLAQELGRRLDIILMQPLRHRLADTRQLLVSPDGLLHLLPLSALVDKEGHYLIETLSLNYLASGRDLLRNTPLRQTGAPLLFANPEFDIGPVEAAPSASLPQPAAVRSRSFVDTRFEGLPGTGGEADAIKALLPNAVVLTGNRATETALKEARGPRILHVATHGFFLEHESPSDAALPHSETSVGEDSMLRSGLVLAEVNARQSGSDDGILTALEATGLDLRGTQVVVLSACETGVGDVATGEGVFGLRRAFMAAGAETLVMSLWQVDDDATSRLMVDYYRRLLRGDGRGDALRQASLTLLRDPAHRHPFYWASFVSVGAWGPMRR